jgi:hypothetical protein
MFKLFVFSALLAICLSAPTPMQIVDSDEIAILSQSQPCRGRVAGTRLRHPTDDHKYLRCVGPESFWIETCPDNLFFNQELDLCDWSTVSETTTAINDIVKFRPVLFRNNKTVNEQVEVISRPVEIVDKSKLPVRVVSSRIRDDTDIAEVRQVPVVVESDEEVAEQPEIVSTIRRVQTPVTTTTVRAPVQVVRPVVVDVDELESDEVKPTIIKKPVVVEEITTVNEEHDHDHHEEIKPVQAIVSRPINVVEVTTRRPITVQEVDVIKPTPSVTTRRPVITTVQEVDVIKPKPAVTTVEEVDVIKPIRPVPGVTVQKPVTIVEPVDFEPKPVKFIARPGASGARVFGALSQLASPRGGLPFSTASVIRTDFVNHKTF